MNSAPIVHVVSDSDIPWLIGTAAIAFFVTMLFARWVSLKMWRSLNRAKRTLKTLPDWCGYLIWLDSQKLSPSTLATIQRLIKEQ